MEEREWVQRIDRPIVFRVCTSSRDQNWRGFTAFVYDASDGYSDEFYEDHSISMHVGVPVLVTSRIDDQRVHRLQVPGDIKVVPAGYSRIWEISAPTRKLTIDITPWFMRDIASSLGLNSDRVAIAPQLHVKDERIERICWNLLAELQSDAPLGRLYAESLGCALAVGLLKNYGPKVLPRPVGMPKRQLVRVLDYIRENISRDLSLAELAGVARVTLADIALQSGFANQSHLSRHMRRVHGFSPATIRRQAR
jgi:AraC family transcriptional regulator